MQRSLFLVGSTVAITLVAFSLLTASTGTRTAEAASGEVVMLGYDTIAPLSPGLQAAFVAAGKTVQVLSPAEWGAMTTAGFDAYDAIVIGDPTCSSFAAGIPTRAAVWGPIVDGNVIVIGTDEQYHASQGGQSLMNSAAPFSVARAGKTGAYVSMSCGGTAPLAQAELNAAFGGTWTAVGTSCGTNVTIVATHPALAGLTDATLSNWGCSTHNAFSTWPTTFEVLAMALEGGFFTAPNGTVGSPYIMARGVTAISDIALTPATATNPVGTPHTLTATVTTNTPAAGTPVVGKTVTFLVESGPNAGVTGTCVTGATGSCTFTYTGTAVGTDIIRARFVDALGRTQTSSAAEKIWVAPTPTPTPTPTATPTPPPAAPGRMTGGGTIAGTTEVKHGFTLNCAPASAPQNLEINWGKGDKFKLDTVTSVSCSTAAGIAPAPPAAGFNTMTGTGTGTCNGGTATITFTFTDAGEPGKNDTGSIALTGACSLSSSGKLQNGNHQAHK